MQFYSSSALFLPGPEWAARGLKAAVSAASELSSALSTALQLHPFLCGSLRQIILYWNKQGKQSVGGKTHQHVQWPKKMKNFIPLCNFKWRFSLNCKIYIKSLEVSFLILVRNPRHKILLAEQFPGAGCVLHVRSSLSESRARSWAELEADHFLLHCGLWALRGGITPLPELWGPPQKSFLSSVSLWASQNITPPSPTEWGMNTPCSEVLLSCLPPKPGGQLACVGVTSLNPMAELKVTSEQGWSHTQASDVCLWACSLYVCTCYQPVWLHIRAAKLTLATRPQTAYLSLRTDHAGLKLISMTHFLQHS